MAKEEFNKYRFIPTHVGNRSFVPGRGPLRPVHPHARGEQPCTHARPPWCLGSSPRTWGTGRRGGIHVSQSRFIPTHVGNRFPDRRTSLHHSVHPHARGEQMLGQIDNHGCSGSSPRTWGTDFILLIWSCRLRFIPTHVGNSTEAGLQRHSESVHPHARGEQTQCLNRGGFSPGSSPRTWGTGQEVSPLAPDHRFIPTHVGNRSAVASRSRFAPVHPHARGEQVCRPDGSSHGGGSSPRTWGTVERGATRIVIGRFIPTHVGNSCTIHAAPPPRSVHPHARGEQVLCEQPISLASGSSPRTWGTEGLQSLSQKCARFIPTHVGNRIATGRLESARSVHPHARGEQVARKQKKFCPIGSSPRTWGTVNPAPV